MSGPAPLEQAPVEQAPRTPAFAIRLVAGCLLLVGLALVQDPGFLVPDTKFDLATAPGEFLGRALHLWDGEGALGQLQNQAYGYLWPMGPFFVLGSLLDLPGWVVQRLWTGLVLSVAFTGAARVTRALGVRSDLACLLAGAAFALSPRMLTTLGPISIEAWPSAVAPWVLLFLVRGSTTGSPRRAAALAGLAVAMVGGVNAAATFAVLPLGVVWLLTRTPGPRRRSLMLWWPTFTLLGTLWWLVPLFVMGAYSPPFLDYIETTSVTTFPTTVFDVLRGTSNWVPYVDAGSRAGNDLLTTSYLVLNSGVLVLLGFLGLADRRTPHRRFLVLAVLLGLLMVAAGHRGAVEGWAAGDVRALLDGVLAPLRNVHKFDPVLRLPLVVGLALVVDRVVTARATRPPSRTTPRAEVLAASVNRAVLVGLAVVAVVGAAVPVATGRLLPAGATLGVPGYWSQTAAWLEQESAGRSALVVPGAPFGDYLWGSPKDEPLQHLARSRWAVRNVIPLTPPGNIRMLDEVETRLAQGHGSPGLVAYLRRAGVRHLVVRNDLVRGNDVPDPVLVHRALEDSPGLRLVAAFGPEVGGGATLEAADGARVVVNGGWQDTYPAVEVYEVPGAVDAAVAAPAPTVVAGGPEDLLDLLDLDVLDDAPTELAADVAAADTADTAADTAAADQAEDLVDRRVVLTDGLRARERFFARIHDGSSAVLTPGDVPRSGNPARDYLLDTDDRWSTTAVLDGATALSASSSRSDADALGGPRRGQLPYAALDGSPATAWVSGAGRSDQAWWRVDLEAVLTPGRVRLVGGPDAPEDQQVRVVTEAGASEAVELDAGETRVVVAPAGPTRWLRVEDATGVPGRVVALAEVQTEGLAVRRRLALPALPDGWPVPDTVVLRAGLDERRGCLVVDGDVRCLTGRDRDPEEPLGMGRVVPLAQAASWTPDLVARPVAGGPLDALLTDDQPLTATASSLAVPDPRASALAAVDGDPRTTWYADPDDARPTLRLSWLGEQRLTRLVVDVDDESAVRRPERLLLTWPGGTREVGVPTSGLVRFPAIRTDQLAVEVVAVDDTVGLGFDGATDDLGTGLTELGLPELSYLPLRLSPDRRTWPCGTGPDVVVAGRRLGSGLVASPRELASGALVPARVCGEGARVPTVVPSYDAPAGDVVVDVVASPVSQPSSLVLTRAGAAGAGAPGDDVVPLTLRSGAATRTAEVPPDAGVLALRQNANPGWVAEQDDRTLRPVVLDGWQQGWVLDGEPGAVTARFAPDATYRAGLLVGLLALLGLVAVVVLGGRRERRRALPPLAERGLPRAVPVVLALLAGGLLAGTGGLAVATLTGLALLLVRPVPARTWVPAVPVLVVAGAYALRPWGSAAGWAGGLGWTTYAMVVPVAGLLLSLAWREGSAEEPAEGSVGRSGTSPFRRRAGRSTTR